jgi:hypothetical protein
MGDVVAGKDIHAVLVQSALERDDELAKVAERADAVDVATLVAEAVEAGDGEVLVQGLILQAAVASVGRMDVQQRMVVDNVSAEGDALRRQDVTKVPAVRNEDIAARRAQQMAAAADKPAPKEEP